MRPETLVVHAMVERDDGYGGGYSSGPITFALDVCEPLVSVIGESATVELAGMASLLMVGDARELLSWAEELVYRLKLGRDAARHVDGDYPMESLFEAEAPAACRAADVARSSTCADLEIPHVGVGTSIVSPTVARTPRPD